MGVVDLGQQADFAQEALGGHSYGQFGVENLESYLGTVGVNGQEYPRGAAPNDFPIDGVPIA